MEEKSSFKKKILLVLKVLVGIVAVTFLAVILFLNTALGRINRVEEQETLSHEQIQAILGETDPPEDTVTATLPDETEPESEATEETVPETEPTEAVTEPEMPTEMIDNEPAVVNILLIGQDRRQHETRQRSDAMILCTVNSETKTLVMTSFLRDTYVQLPKYNGVNYGKNRLNVPYLIGGFEMLNECLELNFGVHVDHNIEVDFSGFKNVIDALGGVDIELTRGEAQIVEGDVQEGMNHLDGGQALMYARIRKLDDDFGRTNRQRKVLSALFEKTRNLGIRDVLVLSDTLIPMITTDMEIGDIIKYITEFYPIWKDMQIITQSVPAKGEFYYEQIDGMSVVIPNMNKVRQKIADTINR